MDHVTALKSAKQGGNWSLMLYTGSWWCPWCQPLEAKVFDTDAWRDYAAERRFYEIELDYPKRDGTGYNCWLWDEGFLKDNNLTDAKATAALKDFYAQQNKYALADAAKQVCTNGGAKVTYKKIGYPTVLVLRPDGTVAGRFSPDVREYKDKEGNPTNFWSEAEALALVTNEIERIIAAADTHVTASVAEECAGMGTVTALDKTVYTGTSVALKATAAKGFFFAGWYDGAAPAETASDYRTANNTYVTMGGEANLEAVFVTAADDFLAFDFSSILSGFSVDEEVDVSLDVSSATAPTVTVSGLPTGLKFDAKTLKITGSPKKEGFFYVSVSAKNASGYVFSQTIPCVVGEPDEPALADFVDLVGSEEHLFVGESVGDESDIESAMLIGEYSAEDNTGVTKVTGLPAGLKCVTVKNGETTSYYVIGVPTKAGLSKVTISGTSLDCVTGALKKETCIVNFIVDTAPSVYVAAFSGDNGAVSGGGVCAYGSAVNISAKPKPGHVFAGWYSDEDMKLPFDGSTFDYRDPAPKAMVDDSFDHALYAKFVLAEDDMEIEIVGQDFVDGDEVDFDSGEGFLSLAYTVESVSLPTVKVTGLPAGFTYATSPSAGTFTIDYNPLTAKSFPAPGKYAVKIVASNASKAAASLAFTIRVANWQCEQIVVEDAYPDDEYGFAPGFEIAPLDFSEAVDFAGGFTLAVSGLPKGLVFNAKAIAAKGIVANTVTGKPTVPGDYVVTFTAKKGRDTYLATATFIVAPFPQLNVEIADEDAIEAGCKVSGGGGYMAGSKVTLKAVAAKGWVFAGWDGLEDVDIMTRLNPSLSLVTDQNDSWYGALFLPVSEDWLWISEYDAESGEERSLQLALNMDVSANADAFAKLVDSGSLPALTVTGLPTGLKFDTKTLLLSGKPTKSGIYYANLSGKNAGGYVHSRIVRIVVFNADGSEPEEPEPVNAAALEGLEGLDGLSTGVSAEISLDVPVSPQSGSGVRAVSVTGLPKGLKFLYRSNAGGGDAGDGKLFIFGVAAQTGRCTAKIAVSYVDGSKAAAEKSFTVHDSGSAYLFVQTSDKLLGTVTGEGVYQYGSTVKISAKPAQKRVFSGWFQNNGEGLTPFVTEDGTDYRTPGKSFAFLRDIDSIPIVGTFASADDDQSLSFGPFEVYDECGESYELAKGQAWTIAPDCSSQVFVKIDSVSLPTLTVGKLPAGILYAKTGGYLYYDTANRGKLVPGVYDVLISAQNVSKCKGTSSIRIKVPVPVSEFFSDYNLDQDAGYVAQVGAYSNLEDLSDVVKDLKTAGLDVTFKNLPVGISVSDDGIGGFPTKAGTYTVSITAQGTIDGEPVNETGEFFLSVTPFPQSFVGVYNGEIYTYDMYNPLRTVAVGSLSITVENTGRITAKVVRPIGNFSFTAVGFDTLAESSANVCLFDKTTGGILDLAIDASGGVDVWQANGSFMDREDAGTEYECRAQRNAFGDIGGEVTKIATELVGTYCFRSQYDEETFSGSLYGYAYDEKLTETKAELTVKIDAKGNARFTGKAGTRKFSGSTVLILGRDTDGRLTATAPLVQKNDAESVLLATVVFVYDSDADMWFIGQVADGEGGTVSGASAEIYKSDCDKCIL